MSILFKNMNLSKLIAATPGVNKLGGVLLGLGKKIPGVKKVIENLGDVAKEKLSDTTMDRTPNVIKGLRSKIKPEEKLKLKAPIENTKNIGKMSTSMLKGAAAMVLVAGSL